MPSGCVKLLPNEGRYWLSGWGEWGLNPRPKDKEMNAVSFLDRGRLWVADPRTYESLRIPTDKPSDC